MNIFLKKIIIGVFLFLLSFSFAQAELPNFIDFKKVLNKSTAGSKAQIFLQEKFKKESQKFNQLEQNILKEEKEIISLKKTISNEDYIKKVEKLRKKVANLQTSKQKPFNSISKSRIKAKQDLLNALNPILKKYMQENNVRIILDKKSVLMGDTNLEITDLIITILNKEFPSLKVN